MARCRWCDAQMGRGVGGLSICPHCDAPCPACKPDEDACARGRMARRAFQEFCRKTYRR